MNMTAQPTWDLFRQRWLLLGLIAFFAALSVQYVLKVTHSERSTRSAFLRWNAQLLELNEGENVWAKYQYPNPPIMATILQPFTHLNPLLGSIVWFYLKVAMAVLSIVWVLSLLDDPTRPFPMWGKILAIGLALRPIEGDLVHGNVNLMILFLVVGALYAYSHQREFLAGLLLGLGIACKITPALFVPYFVWKRAWKTLAGTAVGLGLFVILIPTFVYGWSNNLLYLKCWHENMVAPYAAGEVTSEHQNQSLPGVLHRLMTDKPSFSTYVNHEKVTLEQHNVVSWEPAAVQWIVKGCMGVFALLVLWCCRTSTETRPSWRLMAEFSIVVLGMLLFSERTWKHHCVTLLLPFATMSYALSARTVSRRCRWLIGGALVAVVLLMTLTTHGLFAAQERISDVAQVYGVYVMAFVLLAGCLFVMLRQKDNPSRLGQGTGE